MRHARLLIHAVLVTGTVLFAPGPAPRAGAGHPCRSTTRSRRGTLQGTVAAVNTSPRGPGTFVTLTFAAAGRTLEVLVGPDVVLKRAQVTFAAGDALTIVGVAQGNLFLARQITGRHRPRPAGRPGASRGALTGVDWVHPPRENPCARNIPSSSSPAPPPASGRPRPGCWPPQGCHLALGARRVERVAALAAELPARHGVRVLAGALDTRSTASVERFVQDAVEALGGLHVVVANAGLARGRDQLTRSWRRTGRPCCTPTWKG